MDRDKLVLNPALRVATGSKSAYVVGLLIGCALRSGTCLSLDLAATFWKQLKYGSHALSALVDAEPNANAVSEEALAELAAIDTMTADLLRFADRATGAPMDAKQFAEQQLTWTTFLSNGDRVELCPGGASLAVAFDERHSYARAVLRARFHESDAHMLAVRAGLEAVVPDTRRLLLLLTWEELELRICGLPEFDVALLRKHTQYRDIDEKSGHVANFWTVLEGALVSRSTAQLLLVEQASRRRIARDSSSSPGRVRVCRMVIQCCLLIDQQLTFRQQTCRARR